MGTPDRPIAPDHSAVIRLTPVAGSRSRGMPGDRLLRRALGCARQPAAPHLGEIGRTGRRWGDDARPGRACRRLASGRSGHHHRNCPPSRADRGRARERPHRGPRPKSAIIRAIDNDGLDVLIDAPLTFTHSAFKNRRGEVANLSRNVVIESAAPSGVRGHTMYHRHSSGSISYAEFRHLGKLGKLGKYSLHFHRVGDTMRGSSVIGASIWDSANRWITIHGTNTLVVRDCVGYQSTGHGFFLEDGTEVENILDRNLAVAGLPGQAAARPGFPAR